MFIGLFLVRPSLFLIVLAAATSVLLHFMVLKEEAYLLGVHGKTYEEYRNTTGRYLPRLRGR
jgi:protein-S-isoprenylcysteine O-methyltransferase Ste14